MPPSGQQRLYADEGNSLVTNLFPFQSSFFFYIRQITCSSVLFSEEYQRSLPSCLHTGQMLYHTAKQGFYFERLDFFAPLVVSHSALCVCVCVFLCVPVCERDGQTGIRCGVLTLRRAPVFIQTRGRGWRRDKYLPQ